MTKTLVGADDADEPWDEQPWRPTLTAPGAAANTTGSRPRVVGSEAAPTGETWAAPQVVTQWTVSWPSGG